MGGCGGRGRLRGWGGGSGVNQTALARIRGWDTRVNIPAKRLNTLSFSRCQQVSRPRWFTFADGRFGCWIYARVCAFRWSALFSLYFPLGTRPVTPSAVLCCTSRCICAKSGVHVPNPELFPNEILMKSLSPRWTLPTYMAFDISMLFPECTAYTAWFIANDNWDLRLRLLLLTVRLIFTWIASINICMYMQDLKNRSFVSNDDSVTVSHMAIPLASIAAATITHTPHSDIICSSIFH